MSSSEIDALREELAAFKAAVNQRLDQMEARLTGQSALPGSTTIETPSSAAVQSAPVESVSPVTKAPPPPSVQTQKPQTEPTPAPLYSEKPPAGLSWLKTALQPLLTMILGWMEPILNMYSSYQKRGLGHVFLLTVGGIGLTLVGVGYLMQLVVEQLGAGIKVMIFAGISAGVILGGFRLAKKDALREFAIAIVALGLLIGYTTVYFSGNVYYLLTPVLTLALYCLVAFACHAIALFLNANIIYSLGILGIALLPMLAAKDGHDAVVYLSSVCLVSLSSLWFAHQHRLQWLTGLTLAGAFIASEWVGLTSTTTVLMMSVLFLAIAVQIGLSFERCDLKKLAPVLAGYAGGWITLLYLNHQSVANWTLVTSALMHAVAAGIFAYRFRMQNKLAQTVFTLLCSLWFFIAAMFFLGQAHWGLAWLTEGAVLLYLASRLDMKQAIVTAQGLILVAIVYNFVALAPYLPFPALRSIDGWTLALSILAGLAWWIWQLGKCAIAFAFDDKARSVLHFALAAWLSFLILASLGQWLDTWITLAVFLWQIALLAWARHIRESLIEVLVVLLCGIPFVIAFLAFDQADSLYIGDIDTTGKVAVLTLFAQLWLWSAFYRRFYPTSSFAPISEAMRIAFYLLLPVAWIGASMRHLDDATVAILWLSPLIALGLTAAIKHWLLALQTKVLCAANGVFLLLGCAVLDWPIAMGGLAGQVVLFALAHAGKYRFKLHMPTSFVLSNVLIMLGLSLPLAIGIITESLVAAAWCAGVYWLLVYLNPINRVWLRRERSRALAFNRVVLALSLLATLQHPWLASLPLTYLILGWGLNKTALIAHQYSALHMNIQRHVLIGLTYSTFLFGFDTSGALLFFGPLLAVHGVFVVLHDRSHLSVTKLGFALLAAGILKVAVWDVNTTELWQKVLMFIGIGCFLLLAAFWYQKLMLNYQQSEQHLPPEAP